VDLPLDVGRHEVLTIGDVEHVVLLNTMLPREIGWKNDLFLFSMCVLYELSERPGHSLGFTPTYSGLITSWMDSLVITAIPI